MNALTNIHRRPYITCLAVTLALLGSSFGVAKSASAAAPEHPEAGRAQVTSIRHHLGHIEAESGEVRHPLETLNLATARPLEPRGSAAGGSPSGGSR
jgi:hypothetical protein